MIVGAILIKLSLILSDFALLLSATNVVNKLH